MGEMRGGGGGKGGGGGRKGGGRKGGKGDSCIQEQERLPLEPKRTYLNDGLHHETSCLHDCQGWMLQEHQSDRNENIMHIFGCGF